MSKLPAGLQGCCIVDPIPSEINRVSEMVNIKIIVIDFSFQCKTDFIESASPIEFKKLAIPAGTCPGSQELSDRKGVR